MPEPTPDAHSVRHVRRFVVRRPDHPDLHGVQFPTGRLLADSPETGFVGAVSIEALCEGLDEHTVHWADAPLQIRREHLITPLDADILQRVARGEATVQIAARLYLSRQGVEYHVGLMLRRFKAANRAALVARAHQVGVLDAGTWPPRVRPEYIKAAERTPPAPRRPNPALKGA